LAPARVALWCVTLTALAVCARALWIDVVPGPLLVAVAVSLTATLGFGIARPTWQMFGEVTSELPAPAPVTAVCIEVADVELLPQLLAGLEQRHVRLSIVLRSAAARAVESAESARAGGQDVVLGVDAAGAWLGIWSSSRLEQHLRRARRLLGLDSLADGKWLLLPTTFTTPGVLHAARRLGCRALYPRQVHASQLTQPLPGEVLLVELSGGSAFETSLGAFTAWLSHCRESGCEVVTLANGLSQFPPSTNVN
jgi:hypothetical protein